MCTSDNYKAALLNRSLFYAVLTLITALFGAVYEVFSHEVYSYFMIYAFAIPLALGVVPSLCALRFGKAPRTGVGSELWGFGVVTLTIGCLFNGVLEIYGTTNALVAAYPVAGVFLLAAGLVLWLRAAAKSVFLKHN